MSTITAYRAERFARRPARRFGNGPAAPQGVNAALHSGSVIVSGEAGKCGHFHFAAGAIQ